MQSGEETKQYNPAVTFAIFLISSCDSSLSQPSQKPEDMGTLILQFRLLDNETVEKGDRTDRDP